MTNDDIKKMREVQDSLYLGRQTRKLLDNYGLYTLDNLKFVLDQHKMLVNELSGGKYSKLTTRANDILWEVKEKLNNAKREAKREVEKAYHVGVRAKWDTIKSASGRFEEHKCSFCGSPPMEYRDEEVLTDYCPDCGARMDGGEEDKEQQDKEGGV